MLSELQKITKSLYNKITGCYWKGSLYQNIKDSDLYAFVICSIIDVDQFFWWFYYYSIEVKCNDLALPNNFRIAVVFFFWYIKKISIKH